jgi:hypothetical protein
VFILGVLNHTFVKSLRYVVSSDRVTDVCVEGLIKFSVMITGDQPRFEPGVCLMRKSQEFCVSAVLFSLYYCSQYALRVTSETCGFPNK